MMKKMWVGLILQLENRWEEKSFLLGANINTNTNYGYRESYLCLYLGFWSLFIGFSGERKESSCGDCSNYNIGDGVDDISKCIDCDYK